MWKDRFGRLMAGEEQQQEEEEEEAVEEDVDDEHSEEEVELPLAEGEQELGKRAVARYDYYVAQYEVVAAASDIEQPKDARRTHRSKGPPLSIHPSLLADNMRLLGHISTATESQPSSNSTTVSSNSTSSSSTSSEYTSSRSSTAATLPAAATSVSALSSPSRIAELQSSWRTTPNFINSVTDLVILGEGSSGVVYRGIYRGVACVVKLPKSVSLTGAAWREWQCHLCVPPHNNLVRFLGALPMSATNYLVLSFVRQGSLHFYYSLQPKALCGTVVHMP